jgi:uncharacterized RDD family membrane protein YckC
VGSPKWTAELERELRRELATHPSPEGLAGAGPADQGTRRGGAAGAGYGHANKGQRIAGMEPEGVALRFVALLIDGVPLLVFALILALMSGGTSTSSTNGTHTADFQVGGGGFLVWLLIVFVYYVSCEVLLGGTLGKLVLRLRVVDEEGSAISWGASVVRNLMRIVDGLFFYLIGAIAIWSSPAQQRLGDRAAHTYVVRRSRSD